MKKSYDSKFKSRVALEVLRGKLTVAEIAGKYTAPPHLAKRNRTDAPYNHSRNRPFFKCFFSKCAEFPGRYRSEKYSGHSDLVMVFSACFSGKIKNGILTPSKGLLTIPYTLQYSLSLPRIHI